MHAASDAPSRQSLFAPAWRNLSIGSIALCSMLAFEAMGVAAGMPAVAAALGGLSWYALAFASTLAGSVVAMVWAGFDCDRHGPFRSMAGGMAAFGAGLLLAGLAGSMPMLVLGRVVQGLGVGALGVALYVASAHALPPALHPRLFALFSSAWVLPAIVGPAVAGLIVEHLGWRWLFLGILALLLPAAALILAQLPRHAGPAAAAGPSRGALRWAWLAACGSIAALGGLALAVRRLLPAGTLRLAPGLPTVIALRGLIASAFFLGEAFVPLWLHQERGWSITAAGLALTGGALCWSLGSHLQSRVDVEARRERLLARGCALLCLGIVVSGLAVSRLLPEWVLVAGWSIAGLGTGVALPMLGVLTLQRAPRAQQGRYASALQLCAATGTSATLAAGGVLFALLHPSLPASAFVAVFSLAAVLAGAAWAGTRRAFVACADAPLPGGGIANEGVA
jgi:MFS family permease